MRYVAPMSLIDDIDPSILANTIATVATLGESGDPQLTAVWFAVEDGKVIVSAKASRKKTKNLAADGRTSVLIFHPDTPDYYVEIRGTAEVLDDSDYVVADRIAKRYNADFRSFDGPNDRRTIISVTAERVLVTDVRSEG